MAIEMDRRALVAGMALGGVAASTRAAAQVARPQRRAHAIVGVGHRSRMFQDAIWGAHKEHSSLVGVCDTNPGRLSYVQKRAAQAGAPAPRTFLASEFDRMLRETKPAVVIVTTPDAIHAEYIVRALDAGCDVVTEKPMTTDAAMARRILDAVERNKRHVRVTFNYRYAPFRTQIKELLMAGEIGDILSVDFNWLLDTTHGADYFRRWHSRKAISGGLMVHKATHHFDLVNWWLSANPVSVAAKGKREFYTPAMAQRLGLDGPHERCLTCPEKNECSFRLDITADAGLKALYLDNEKYDGYYRDRCVWRPEIDIEDTMNVAVQYDTGATLSYSLNACNAWEGYHIAFNGTKGRLEHSNVEKTYVAGGDMVQGGSEAGSIRTRLYPLRGAPRDIKPAIGEGGHGGGDTVMLAELFGPQQRAVDPTMRAADERGGCASILIGIAANQCFRTGDTVAIAQLVPNLPKPILPPMPTRQDRVPMPPILKRAGEA